MADRSVADGAAAAEPDPIYAVTGVPTSEVIRRCSAIRGQGAIGRRVRRRRVDAGSDAWRLLDFADLSDDDFVRDVHRVLVGRGPSPSEAERRLRELREHASRLELVIRLALSPEGRRAARPRVRGIGLPLLTTAARAIEAAQANGAVSRVFASVENAGRARFERSPRHEERGQGGTR